jgi:hypothetical protein
VSPRSFGIEAITDEDRAYGGSRFSDVREALFANPYQRIWGAHGEPPLPVHPVTLPITRGHSHEAVDGAVHPSEQY